MKIGVIGASGQLGRELVKKGCLPLRGRLFSEELFSAMHLHNPDAIINCAADTDVDGCQENIIRAVATNAGGVQWLSEAYGGYIIQISTDYVFDGLAGPYGVRDAPNPLSIYGWSKLGGELAAKRHRGPNLIIRTTILFSSTNNNFVAKVVKQFREKPGEYIKMYGSHLSGTPTYVPPLATEIIRIIKAEYTGLAHIAGHIAGNQTMTRMTFAKEIANAFGYNPSLIVQAKDDNYTGAPRPVKAGLVCDHTGYRTIKSHDILQGLSELASQKGAFEVRPMERGKQ